MNPTRVSVSKAGNIQLLTLINNVWHGITLETADAQELELMLCRALQSSAKRKAPEVRP